MATHPELAAATSPLAQPATSSNASLRLTKEQLAAAERTREYHVRKLQQQVNPAEMETDLPVRAEH